jgi:hypothetical protein
LFFAASSDQGCFRLLVPRKLCSRDRKNATMVATVVAILMAKMLALWQKDILSKGVTEFLTSQVLVLWDVLMLWNVNGLRLFCQGQAIAWVSVC